MTFIKPLALWGDNPCNHFNLSVSSLKLELHTSLMTDVWDYQAPCHLELYFKHFELSPLTWASLNLYIHTYWYLSTAARACAVTLPSWLPPVSLYQISCKVPVPDLRPCLLFEAINSWTATPTLFRCFCLILYVIFCTSVAKRPFSFQWMFNMPLP